MERHGLRVGRVLGVTASEAIASGVLVRIDDQSTVCGEQWGAAT